MNAERRRLEEDRLGVTPWRKWGPYLSERQWGTVREDYSADGNAWGYFPHGAARSRAYRWGEDGLAGWSDEEQRLCLALALWNGKDPFLKERLFGLTNGEGNHGEDVKELYYYLDATPTASYARMLYKYPQRCFPYAWLVEESRRRTRNDPEFELLDTGIFDDDRYFDVFVEYARSSPEDVLMRVTIHNRGPDAAPLHVLPTLWFRNIWSWSAGSAKPTLAATDGNVIAAVHPEIGAYTLRGRGSPDLLFCENDTNVRRLFNLEAPGSFPKDAIHDYLVGGQRNAVNPARRGTKVALHHTFTLPPGGSAVVRVSLGRDPAPETAEAFDSVVEERRREADEFYEHLQHHIQDPDARLVQRQALAGMVWSKQFYHYNVPLWLTGDPAQPPPPASRLRGRNSEWTHVHNTCVISMPDKWEYPWYAAWDLAFHCVAFALTDPEFAKQQLILLTREWYTHPNGQLPAYEWDFGDVNPPVHAWAAWRVFQIDRRHRGDHGDRAFLEGVFHKLLMTFTWWVNRKDAAGQNIFHGGFLGMDNIGVFDRNLKLPDGQRLNQADATAWMAMFCLQLMRIAIELALYNPVYQNLATKFFEHFLGIAEAMTKLGADDSAGGLWDAEDEFYYDEVRMADGTSETLKVRSMVGLVPLFAVETLEPECLARLPEFNRRLEWYLKHRPELAKLVSRWHEPGRGDRRLLSLLRGHRVKCLLRRMLDPAEFLSDYGIRSLSKYHETHPYTMNCRGQSLTVTYRPGESDSAMFGGNSNWRGPIWFPVNYLLIESLQKFHHYYGDDFKVECPTGSGKMTTLLGVADDLTERLTRLFLRGPNGRPCFGAHPKMQTDPHFKDYLLFHEHFHGDTGRGLGAEHQTGWTGLVAKLLQPRRPSVKPVHECDGETPPARPAAART